MVLGCSSNADRFLHVDIGDIHLPPPLSKRIGELLDQMRQDREGVLQRHTDLVRLTEALKRVSGRLDGIEERLDFTERVLESPRAPKRPVRPPDELARPSSSPNTWPSSDALANQPRARQRLARAGQAREAVYPDVPRAPPAISHAWSRRRARNQGAQVMAEPFKRRGGKRAGLTARFSGRGKRQAIREIESLLAGAGRVSDVSAERLAEVARTHGIDLERQLRAPLRSLYRRFLEHCLVDEALSEQEAVDIAHLRRLLSIDRTDAATIHDHVARAVYGAALDRVLSDYQLDPAEEAFLERLREDLQLGESDAQRLMDESAERARRRYLSKAVSESVLLASGETAMELTGSSSSSIEDAIRTALAEPCRALPALRQANVNDIRVEIAEGEIVAWHVKLRAVFAPE